MGRFFLYATSAFLLCAVPSSVKAQTTQGSPLSLTDALTRVLAEHPALDAAEASVARARSAVRDAESARYPGLSLDASGVRFQKPMVVAPLHGFNPANPPEFDKTLLQGSLTAAYTLFDAGARGARVSRTHSSELAAESSEAAARQKLVAETAVLYVTIATLREIMRAQALRMDAVRAERNRAARLFAEGKAARVAVLRADAALSAARADSVSAAGDRDVAESELARMMNVDAALLHSAGIAVPQVSITDADLTRSVLLDRARRNNPDLQRLEFQLQAVRQTRVEARSTRLPKVQVGARLLEYGSVSGLASQEWQTGMQLSWPVFTGGSTSAAAQRADAEIDAAQAELDIAELRIADALDHALASLQTSRARTVAINTAAMQQEEVARIEKLALDTGTGVQTDYLNAEAELFRLRASLFRSANTELQALIDIAHITGELTPAWLKSTLERTP